MKRSGVDGSRVSLPRCRSAASPTRLAQGKPLPTFVDGSDYADQD